MGTRVDVIIPTLNAESFISEALESVLAQEALGNVFVVDNGSTDRTVAIASGFTGVSVLLDNRPGANYARNTGLEYTKRRFVKFLDADDILEPGCLQTQLSCAEQAPESGIIFSDYRLKRNGKCSFVSRKGLCHRESECSQLAEIIWNNIPISSPLYPVNKLKAVGGFDIKLKSRQEWNLNARLSLNGCTFIHCGGLSFVQRVHTSSQRISNRPLDFEREMQTLTRAIAPMRGLKDDRVRDALAGYVWNTGIRFIWNGTPKDSRPFFELAKSIEAHDMHRRQKRYRRTFYSLFGHERGEIALTRVAAAKRALLRLREQALSGCRMCETR